MITIQSLKSSVLILQDKSNVANARPADSRVHLDAAIGWLKHAQDGTGNGGVAQTYLVR